MCSSCLRFTLLCQLENQFRSGRKSPNTMVSQQANIRPHGVWMPEDRILLAFSENSVEAVMQSKFFEVNDCFSQHVAHPKEQNRTDPKAKLCYIFIDLLCFFSVTVKTKRHCFLSKCTSSLWEQVKTNVLAKGDGQLQLQQQVGYLELTDVMKSSRMSASKKLSNVLLFAFYRNTRKKCALIHANANGSPVAIWGVEEGV